MLGEHSYHLSYILSSRMCCFTDTKSVLLQQPKLTERSNSCLLVWRKCIWTGKSSAKRFLPGTQSQGSCGLDDLQREVKSQERGGHGTCAYAPCVVLSLPLMFWPKVRVVYSGGGEEGPLSVTCYCHPRLLGYVHKKNWSQWLPCQ